MFAIRIAIRIGHAVVTVVCVRYTGRVRRGFVEIRRGDVAALGKLSLVPTDAADTLAGRQLVGPGLHLRDHVGHVLDRRIAQIEHVGRLGKMTVRVNESRRGRTAVQIDHLRRVTDEPPDRGIGPDGHDLADRNRQRLGDRIARVHRDDRAVVEDEIGGRHLRPRLAIAQNKNSDGDEGSSLRNGPH